MAQLQEKADAHAGTSARLPTPRVASHRCCCRLWCRLQRIRENYGAIRMRPKDFVAFLTTELRMRLLHSALPDNAAAGFDRPVHVLCRDE